MKHKHAELMALYAQDAMETETPWERWEFRSEAHPGTYQAMSHHPVWYLNSEYRRKPRTIRIGEYDVPEPMREAPKPDSFYFVPTIISRSSSCVTKWNNVEYDLRQLKNGLCHSTREAAELHAKALISLTQKQLNQ